MTRIDRNRLNEGRYRVTLEVPTRFNDLDMQAHINNTAAAVILQEAQGRFNMAPELAWLMRPGERLIVAATTIEYVAEMYHPFPLTVYTGVLHIGRTSFTLAQIARQNEACVLYSQATIVITDNDGPVQLRDDLRAAYGSFCIDSAI